MKPITALVIDGPAEGQIITTDRSPFIAWSQPRTAWDDPTEHVEVEPSVYTLQRFAVGGRMWNVLTTATAPTGLDSSRVLLALIDADPQANRMCEVTR